MKRSMSPPCHVRQASPTALITPIVAARSPSSSRATASTIAPTRSASGGANSSGTPAFSTRSSARSVDGSRPTIVAVSVSPFARTISISSLSSA